MADSVSFEGILAAMLDRAPADMDKREGSILYDALAPTAYMLARQNQMIALLTDQLYPDTAQGMWLDRAVGNFGLVREAATQALRRIDLTDRAGQPLTVPEGTRFMADQLVFVTGQEIGPGSYEALCQQPGTQGNRAYGPLLPVDTVSQLGLATLAADPLVPARDEETDEQLRARFDSLIRQSPYGGNKADYVQKALQIEGVGAAVAFGAPQLEEPGHVGLVVGDENQRAATSQLLERVRQLFGSQGDGIAPVGHTVTVKTGQPVALTVAVQLQLAAGASAASVQAAVAAAVEESLAGVGFEDGTIFQARLVSAVLGAHPGIVDVPSLTINGQAKNLVLEKSFANFQLPGEVTLSISEVETA